MTVVMNSNNTRYVTYVIHSFTVITRVGRAVAVSPSPLTCTRYVRPTVAVARWISSISCCCSAASRKRWWWWRASSSRPRSQYTSPIRRCATPSAASTEPPGAWESQGFLKPSIPNLQLCSGVRVEKSSSKNKVGVKNLEQKWVMNRTPPAQNRHSKSPPGIGSIAAMAIPRTTFWRLEITHLM